MHCPNPPLKVAEAYVSHLTLIRDLVILSYGNASDFDSTKERYEWQVRHNLEPVQSEGLLSGPRLWYLDRLLWRQYVGVDPFPWSYPTLVTQSSVNTITTTAQSPTPQSNLQLQISHAIPPNVLGDESQATTFNATYNYGTGAGNTIQQSCIIPAGATSHTITVTHNFCFATCAPNAQSMDGSQALVVGRQKGESGSSGT